MNEWIVIQRSLGVPMYEGDDWSEMTSTKRDPDQLQILIATLPDWRKKFPCSTFRIVRCTLEVVHE